MDGFAQAMGFDSEAHMDDMIAFLDTADNTRAVALAHWKETDGTKAGLNAIYQGAYLHYHCPPTPPPPAATAKASSA